MQNKYILSESEYQSLAKPIIDYNLLRKEYHNYENKLDQEYQIKLEKAKKKIKSDKEWWSTSLSIMYYLFGLLIGAWMGTT